MNTGQDHEDTPGRAPPEHARLHRSQYREDGAIEVGGDRLEELIEQIDWDDLSPFEKWIVAVLDENGLLDE